MKSVWAIALAAIIAWSVRPASAQDEPAPARPSRGLSRLDPSRATRDKAARNTTDEYGRTFRTQFDPGSELRLGWLSGAAHTQDWKVSHAVQHGIAYRARADFGGGASLIRWQFDHHMLWGRTHIRQATWGVPAMDVALYSGTYLRHTASPVLMLPSNPPTRMFFPFDVGAQAEGGRVRVLHAPPDSIGRVHVGVARAALMLDPWRSGKPGRSLELQVGIRYDLDVVQAPQGASSNASVTHRLAPFTDTALRFRYQDEPGLFAMNLRANWFPHWVSDKTWRTDAWEASAELSRVLLAINDEPVSFVVDMGYVRTPPAPRVDGQQEVRLLAGLSLGYQLR